MQTKKIKLVASLSQFMQSLVRHYPAATIFTISCCIAFFYGYFEAFGVELGGIFSLEDVLINSIYFAMTQFVMAVLFVMMMAAHPVLIIMYGVAWLMGWRSTRKRRKSMASGAETGLLSADDQEGRKTKRAEERKVRRELMKKRRKSWAGAWRVGVVVFAVTIILGIVSQIFLLIKYWIPWAREGRNLFYSWLDLWANFGPVLKRLIGNPNPFVSDAFWYDAFLLAVITLSMASIFCLSWLLILAVNAFANFIVRQIHQGRGAPVFVVGGGLIIVGYYLLGHLVFGQDSTAAVLRNTNDAPFEEAKPADFRKVCLERGQEIWDGDKYRLLLCQGNVYKVRGEGPLVLVAPETALRAHGTREARPYTQNRAMDFLDELYSHYDGKQAFSPLAEAAPHYFDAGLLGLIRENERQGGSAIGALGHDPFCQCQDSEAVVADMKVLSATASTLRVAVVLSDKGGLELRTVTYDLVKVRGRWRIHDLSSGAMTSLRERLMHLNAGQAKKSPDLAAE